MAFISTGAPTAVTPGDLIRFKQVSPITVYNLEGVTEQNLEDTRVTLSQELLSCLNAPATARTALKHPTVGMDTQ